MNTQTMYNFAFLHAGTVIAATLALFAGEAVNIFDAAGDHPALTAVLAGTGTALLVKYVDKWLDGRNKTIKTGDKILELEHADKENMRQQQAQLMADKDTWWKTQNDRIKAELFETRQRYRVNLREASQINHGAVNQIMAQQHIILGMQRTLTLAGLPVPEASILELTKFMLPIWEQENDNIHGTDDAHKTNDTSKP